MAETLTADQITHYRKKVLLSALALEIGGMKRRGHSAYSIIKQETGFKGSRQKVYDQFKRLVDEESRKASEIAKDWNLR